MEHPHGQIQLKAIKEYRSRTKYPTINDIIGAVRGFSRLQIIYNLDPLEVMEGRINGIDYGYSLNSKNLFKLGTITHTFKYHYLADDWFKASLKKYDSEDSDIKNNFLNFTKKDILEGAIRNKYDQKDFLKSALYCDQLIKVDPENDFAIRHNSFITATLSFEETTGNKTKIMQDERKPFNNNEKNYHKGCRGEFKIILSVNHYCYYLNKYHPFTILAPFKVEVISEKNPDLVLFHDVLSDHEISKLQNLAKNKLTEATTVNPNLTEYRVSKVAWVYNNDDPFVDVLNQRLEDMTGLSMKTAEPFQINNYGIGGHYNIHNDYFGAGAGNLDSFMTHGIGVYGNRIATIMFYVGIGGPFLKINIFYL